MSIWITVATVVTVVVGLGLIFFAPGRAIPLTDSHGVKITSASVISTGGKSAFDLVERTETELLTGVDIFSGRIIGIQSIKISFPDWEDYSSIVTISIDEVIRGDLKPGDTTRLLVSPAIGLKCSICDALEALRNGSNALYLATPASEGWAASVTGDGIFQYSDVADYYLMDPSRPLFVDHRRNDELVYAQFAWPTIAAQSPTSVTEVAEIIQGMM
jgi:hypothetical protein